MWCIEIGSRKFHRMVCVGIMFVHGKQSTKQKPCPKWMCAPKRVKIGITAENYFDSSQHEKATFFLFLHMHHFPPLEFHSHTPITYICFFLWVSPFGIRLNVCLFTRRRVCVCVFMCDVCIHTDSKSGSHPLKLCSYTIAYLLCQYQPNETQNLINNMWMVIYLAMRTIKKKRANATLVHV